MKRTLGSWTEPIQSFFAIQKGAFSTDREKWRIGEPPASISKFAGGASLALGMMIENFRLLLSRHLSKRTAETEFGRGFDALRQGSVQVLSHQKQSREIQSFSRQNPVPDRVEGAIPNRRNGVICLFTYLLAGMYWLISLGTSHSLYAQTYTNADSAFAIAQASQRPVLLIFSGSDWCMPCIRFEKQVLASEPFEAFAPAVVMLRADFPQRSKQAKALRLQNEALAERYNRAGTFPQLVLLDDQGTLLQVLETANQTPRSFIRQLTPWLTPMSSPSISTRTAKLMGCAFTFKVVAPEDEAAAYLDQAIAEMQRLEALLSIYQPTSEVSQINAAAGQASVAVSPEVFALIQRSKQLAQFTQGAFDPTAGVLKPLYNFKQAPIRFPDSTTRQEALSRVGYPHIYLADSPHVKLTKAGMKLDFGAIGKGFGADETKKLLVSQGVAAGVINASGDLTAWGSKPDGTPWTVGISDPDDTSKVLFWLPLRNASIATSGDYEQYFEYQGQRYSHTIDPKTGYPTQGIKSVSVISPSAELSDALATALAVMGVEVGLNLINQLPDTHCLIIDAHNQVFRSDDLEIIVEGEE